MEIVKLLCETGEVANTVVVAVGKCLDVQLINDCVLVPVLSDWLEEAVEISATTFMALSDTSEQQRRIADPRRSSASHATPFEYRCVRQ